MQMIYHGHACVQINLKGKSLIIDPFLEGNPKAKVKPDDIKVDHVLLTHAHGDHIQDADRISLNNNAPIVAIPELAQYMQWKGCKTIDMNIGGTVDLEYAKVTMIHAFHSSSITIADEKRIVYGGMPAGYIIRTEEFTVLHSGDTGLFSDMKMFGERYQIDLAFLPIGDHYTMGPEDAVQAAQWLNAKMVIPIHYNTFPVIEQDGEAFVNMLNEKGIQGKALNPGEMFELT